jgi:hypothetical protein
MIAWQSLILIWACAGNPSALPGVNPDPYAAGCQRDHWGYTDPVLDFQTLSDCNTAGHRMTQQNPRVYVTWRCVADPNKPPPGEESK